MLMHWYEQNMDFLMHKCNFNYVRCHVVSLFSCTIRKQLSANHHSAIYTWIKLPVMLKKNKSFVKAVIQDEHRDLCVIVQHTDSSTLHLFPLMIRYKTGIIVKIMSNVFNDQLTLTDAGTLEQGCKNQATNAITGRIFHIMCLTFTCQTCQTCQA